MVIAALKLYANTFGCWLVCTHDD
ncbi:hypothetical protein DA718_22885 [Klebsiella huaxiensis]|nr:hypothetical protein DA718_22885 [Klebsiella huaxiensis]